DRILQERPRDHEAHEQRRPIPGELARVDNPYAKEALGADERAGAEVDAPGPVGRRDRGEPRNPNSYLLGQAPFTGVMNRMNAIIGALLGGALYPTGMPGALNAAFDALRAGLAGELAVGVPAPPGGWRRSYAGAAVRATRVYAPAADPAV